MSKARFKKNHFLVIKEAIDPKVANFVYNYFMMKRQVTKTFFDFKYINQTIKSILKEKIKVEALSKKILSEITPFVSDSVLKGEKNIKLFIEKNASKVDHKA